MPSVRPGLDSLDDEEPLTGLDESESPGLSHERRVARRVGELALQSLPLIAKALDLPRPVDERVPCVDVRVQRAVVEKPDEAERPDAKPATNEDGAPRPATPPL
jgi:hypothetical protein